MRAICFCNGFHVGVVRHSRAVVGQKESHAHAVAALRLDSDRFACFDDLSDATMRRCETARAGVSLLEEW